MCSFNTVGNVAVEMSKFTNCAYNMKNLLFETLYWYQMWPLGEHFI